MYFKHKCFKSKINLKTPADTPASTPAPPRFRRAQLAVLQEKIAKAGPGRPRRRHGAASKAAPRDIVPHRAIQGVAQKAAFAG